MRMPNIGFQLHTKGNTFCSSTTAIDIQNAYGKCGVLRSTMSLKLTTSKETIVVVVDDDDDDYSIARTCPSYKLHKQDSKEIANFIRGETFKLSKKKKTLTPFRAQ